MTVETGGATGAAATPAPAAGKKPSPLLIVGMIFAVPIALAFGARALFDERRPIEWFLDNAFHYAMLGSIVYLVVLWVKTKIDAQKAASAAH